MKNKPNNLNHTLLRLLCWPVSLFCVLLAFKENRLLKSWTARAKIVPTIYFTGKNRFILPGFRFWQ